MIDIATAVVSSPVKGAPATTAKAMAGEFTRTLASVAAKDGAPSDATAYAPPTDLPAPIPPDTTPYADLVLLDLSGKRQRLAGGGKEAPPKSAPIGEADEDASKDMIWSPVAMPLPLPLPTVTPIALPTQSGAVAPLFADSGPSILVDPAQVGIASGDAVAKPLPAAGEQAGQTAPVAAKESVAAPITDKIDLAIRIDAAPTMRQTQAAPVTQLAGQAFAAAIAAVVQSHRDEREPSDTRAPLAVTAAALEAVHKPAVAASADAKQGALDLRQDSGLQGMIDRIESLRDDANARDTRIRLVPDALGTVDVSMRKDGERVHVHFAAENQASARLLTDAQPRLADLAEARGVKLGQTSVGSGADSSAGNARRQPAPFLPAAPAAILAADAADTTDTRIA